MPDLDIEVHNPTTPFSVVAEKYAYAGRATEVVNELTSDQAKYALWATLVILFGSQESNSPELILTHELSPIERMQEAHLILAQIGCAFHYSTQVNNIKTQVLHNLSIE